MPSLPLLGTLLDTAGAAGSARGANPAAASNGPDSPVSTAPFAQTLRQSVQSQRQANGGAQSNGASQSNGSASANDPGTPTTSPTSTTTAGTPTTGAKPSSGKGDGSDDDSNTQAAQTTPDPAQAAALAAAAAVQAQLQARPDAASQPADEAADAAASIADAASALAAKLDAKANGAKTDATGAANAAPATIRDALQSALDKLTNGGQGAAVPTVTQGTGGGSRASADNAQPHTPLAAKGMLTDKAVVATNTTPTAAVDAAATAATSDAKPAASALAAPQPSADANQASLAAASAALQQSVPTTQQPGAAVAGATHALAPQVGGPDWADALGQKVVFLSNAHQQSAELTLNPPDLGPLQVVLRVADNHAHALFVSQHAQVREAVEAALPKLREAMESGGLGLGSASVSDGSFGAAQQQNPQQQSARGQGAQRFGASMGDDGLGDADAALAGTATRRVVGMVDTFA